MKIVETFYLEKYTIILLTSKSYSWIFKDTILSINCRSENPYFRCKDNITAHCQKNA